MFPPCLDLCGTFAVRATGRKLDDNGASMHRFTFLDPRTLAEAFDHLREHGPAASVLAGGTDLLVEIKEKLRRPRIVMNIKRVAELRGFAVDPVGGLSIGALATAREIETSRVVQRDFPGLAQAARELGSIQVRNRATIVGNVCRASPSADTLPPLIADDATVRLVGPSGERVLPLESFFTGPGRTALAPTELLAELRVPAPAPHTGKAYIKHGRRKAMELATVGVAVRLTLERGRCAQVRIVLGAVAPTPIRARRAEALLAGEIVDESKLAAAARAAADEATPISNVRASAGYRREMVGVLTIRALRLALEHAATR